jgi:hypothetical protein
MGNPSEEQGRASCVETGYGMQFQFGREAGEMVARRATGVNQCAVFEQKERREQRLRGRVAGGFAGNEISFAELRFLPFLLFKNMIAPKR